MSGESGNADSSIASIGCLLVVFGAVTTGFGLAALLDISERIELEFFGIELNDRAGRLLWVTGSVAAIGVGLLLMRNRRRAT